MTEIEEGLGAKGLKTKLIVNYLPQSMTDMEFRTLFAEIGELESFKVMRDNNSNYSFGYGFIDFNKPSDAETAIDKLNGYKILNKSLRVAYSKPPGSSKNVNLYISGLTSETDDNNLEELFAPYGELVNTRILRNSDGSSKEVGFALFKQKDNADAAIRGLQGFTDGSGIKLQIKYAKDSSEVQKNHPKYQEYIAQRFMQQRPPMYGMGYQQMASQQMGYQDPYGGGYGASMDYGMGGNGMGGNGMGGNGMGGNAMGGSGMGGNEMSSNNLQGAMRGRDANARYNPMGRPIGGGAGGMGMGMANNGGVPAQQDAAIALFCYNIGPTASDTDLYALFSRFGRITKVDVVEGKGYGFVHMPIPFEAHEAMTNLNGKMHNGKQLQVSLKANKK